MRISLRVFHDQRYKMLFEDQQKYCRNKRPDQDIVLLFQLMHIKIVI